MQLQHDSAEKSKERTAILRREVYLLAAEELTRATNYLASLSQIDLAKTNVTDFKAFVLLQRNYNSLQSRRRHCLLMIWWRPTVSFH